MYDSFKAAGGPVDMFINNVKTLDDTERMDDSTYNVQTSRIRTYIQSVHPKKKHQLKLL